MPCEQGLSKYIHFQQNLAQRCLPPAEKGLLLSNPPYGERLSDSTAVQKLYHQLGELCRGPFADWAIGFVSNRPDFEYDFAGTADCYHRVVNGPKRPVPLLLFCAKQHGQQRTIKENFSRGSFA